jgi:formylglycine-generating enzyme required for sulfatase activity
MVMVPAGSFMMGSPPSEKDRKRTEGPQHRVTISTAFAVGKYEVTFAEWDACVADGGCNGYRPKDLGWGRGDRPVFNVSWNDAHAFVNWLSKRTGQEYRLPSEAEWEYAARANTTARYWWGDDLGSNNANCDGCGSQWDNKLTAPVGTFEANKFGLYDTAGNVQEWVEDCWNRSYEGAPTDGRAWSSGQCQSRVIRSGHWHYYPLELRSAFRSSLPSGFRHDNAGFRVARTLDR